MQKALLLGALAIGALMLAKPRTHQIAATARNEANRLTLQANKVQNTIVSMAASVDRSKQAIGSIVSNVGQVVGQVGRVLNVGEASLPEYNAYETSKPLYSGTDPFVVATGDYGEQLVLEPDYTNVLDPSIYESRAFNA